MFELLPGPFGTGRTRSDGRDRCTETGGQVMAATDIVREIASLPPEAQRQVVDFVAFLKARYPASQGSRKPRRTKLVDEPFIGMWCGRQDMQDGTAWVRNVREREWAQRP